MACPMSIHRLPALEVRPILDHTSIFACSAVVVLLTAAWSSSIIVLPKPTTVKIRSIFIWHLFNALVHFTFGIAYLYNVFFTSMPKLDVTYTRGIHSTPMTPPNISFLGDSKHLHGPFYGSSVSAKLWQEYAKADKRWGGSDLTIISIELLTVFVFAPMALHVCHVLRKAETRKAWFWIAVLATGELYGGLISFLPEWLSGSPNLDISHWLTFWVYLILLRGMWIVFPLWMLWNGYKAFMRPAEAPFRVHFTQGEIKAGS